MGVCKPGFAHAPTRAVGKFIEHLWSADIDKVTNTVTAWQIILLEPSVRGAFRTLLLYMVYQYTSQCHYWATRLTPWHWMRHCVWIGLLALLCSVRDVRRLCLSVKHASIYRVAQKRGHFVLSLVTLEVLIRSASNLAQINAVSFLT